MSCHSDLLHRYSEILDYHNIEGGVPNMDEQQFPPQ